MKKIFFVVALFATVVAISCGGSSGPISAPPASSDAKPGGRLVVSQLSGPTTFNYFYADDNETLTVLGCMNATLMRINRKTQQIEMDLAETAAFSSDGRTLSVQLRPDLKFSDGHRLTAEDVVFTFELIYDPKLPSSVADALKVGGKPFHVEKVDDRTIRFTFAEPYAAVDRLFDIVYILPKHILEPSYKEGKFESSWGLTTPPEQIVTAGPFRLQTYQPDQRTLLAKNPHYFRRDEKGKILPYLDGIDLLILGDKNTQFLKFQQGEVDLLYPVQADNIEALQPQVQKGEVETMDLGPSLITELLWFNLNPGHHATGKPYVVPLKQKWFANEKFRQAVSMAIDRDAIVDVAFSGKARALTEFVSPGEAFWSSPEIKLYSYNPPQATQWLDQIGMQDRDGNGVREDVQGNPITFTLMTNAGNRVREKVGQMIQEDLRKVGIEVNFTPIEGKLLQDKINNAFDYEACLFAIQIGDTDPNAKLNFLLSSGNIHYWYPEQKMPTTPWEAEIDQLMTQQAKTIDQAERKKIYDRLRQIMAERVPVIPLAARNLLIAARQRVGNLSPGILYDNVLWNSEELFIR